MKTILITIFFSFIASIVQAQSSSIDAVHKVRKGFYCTTISGDGWATITFSSTPGKQRSRLIYSPVEFKKEFFSLEFATSEPGPGSWSMTGQKKSFDVLSEVTMKECIRVLNYDGHFDWVKPNPSKLFSKGTVRNKNIPKTKLHRKQG